MFTIPQIVVDTCHTLSKAGFESLLAGGCVRDLLMKRLPRDWDIVTNAPTIKIQELFPQHLEVGRAFGIIKLLPLGTKENLIHIDIAIFRKESGYSDLRHPDQVEPGDIHTDAARRDFTVNAMYYDITRSEVIDLVGGQKDLTARTLRTVGDPKTRFSEDALRVVRTSRFCAQLGFKIDRPTLDAMKACAPLLTHISRERIHEEIFRLLESPRPIMGLESMAQSLLWEPVFGIRRVSIPADFRHLKLNWTPSALHWLCALSVTGLFGDPLKENSEITQRLSQSLKLSNAEKTILKQSLRIYLDSGKQKPTSNALDWVELARRDKPLMDILKSFIRRARGPTQEEKKQAITLIDQALRWALKLESEKQWPSAKELMEEGIKAGPNLGIALKERQWKAFWELRPRS